LFERERPRLTPMAAAEKNVIEKTKQISDPSHINAPLFERWVVCEIVLLRCILHENVAFVVGKIQLSFLSDHPKVTGL
jgi:hypothetical protein